MPTPAEIRAELERRKNAVPAPAPAPAPAPSAQPSGAEAIRAELARRKAAPAPMTGSSGLGPVNPMVAEGRAMAAAAAQVNPTMSPVRPEARGDVAVRKPTLKAPPQRGPVMSPMQREAMAPERAAAEAERRAAQERREAAAAFGGGMDMLPVTDAAGNVSPGTDVDRDLSKTIISSPLQLGQGLAEGSANVINNLTGMAAEGVNTANRFLLGDKAVPFSGTNIQVPSNAIVDGDGALSSVGGLIPRVAGQFMAGRVPLGKALPNGGMGADIAKDALAFAATTDKETPRLSDMLPAGMMDGLRTREGEGYTEAFMKNALEDSVISSAAAGLLKLAGRVMDGPSPQQAGAPPRGTLTPTGNAPTSSLSPAERKAIDLVIRKLEADGVTIDEVVRTAAALGRKGDSGVYETLAEIVSLTGKSSGANTRGLAMAGGAVPGPTQQALIGRVAENADKLPDRLSRAATRATGQNADNAVATLDELETRLKTEAAPKYEEFYAAPVDAKIYDGEIAPVLNAPHGRAAMERAARGLGVEAASLQARVASGAQMQPALQRSYDAAEVLKRALDGENVTLPPLALDHVKRAFDDLIDEAGQGTYTATNLRGAKRNFAESVSRATGGKYGEALGTYENIKRLEEAFDIGLKSLNQKTWELERALAAGSRGSPFSGGEIEAIAMGVARNIEDMIEAGDQRALTALTKDKALKNIATALGSEKAAKTFEQSIRRLAANREFGRRVAGGSDTAMRQAAIRDAGVEAEDVVTKGLDAVERGNVPFSLQSVADASFRAGARKAKEAYRYFRYPGLYDEDVNKALAPLISEPMTETRRNALAASVNARQAERGARRNILPPPGGGAAPKATNKLKPPPRGPRPLPGQTSSSPPMIGGAALGALTSGGATYAATGDEDLALKAGILGGIGGGVVGSRFGKGSTPKAPPAVKAKPGAWKRDPATVGLGTQDYLAYINAKYPPATPNQTPPYFIAASTLKRAGGDRQAAAAELADYAAYLRKNNAKPEVVENADRAAKAVSDVDPMFFDDAAFNARMRSEITAGGEGAMAAVRGSTPDDGISGTMRAERGDMLPGERRPRSGPPGAKPPPVKNGVPMSAVGAGGGAAAGGIINPYDANGDGVIDDADRGLNAVGGAISGGFAGRLMRGGKAPTASAGKFRGPSQQTFAGVNAKTADKVALARAQNMEAEGAGRDAIWDETGWFKGVDGKWRFEIDDSGAKIGSEAALVFGGGRPYPSTMQNVMEHPELYAAYPDMATDAGMIARRNSAAGVYEPELKSATAIAPDLENARSIMLHEAGGHGVQEREGFARGGSIESFTQQKDAQLARDAMYWRKEIAGKRKQMPQADWIAVENALIDDYKKSGIMDWLPSREARDLAHDRISNPDAQLEEIVKVYGLDRNVSVDSPREMYRRTAGEVEARNVQARDAMRMRGEKPGRPWETQDVPDDQQIVRFGSGKAESRPTPPKGQKAPPKGPVKKAPPKKAEEVALINALKKARATETATRRRNVMRDNRDELNRPAEEAVMKAEQDLLEYRDRQFRQAANTARWMDRGAAAANVGKKAAVATGNQIKKTMMKNDAELLKTYAFAVGGIGATALGMRALAGPDGDDDKKNEVLPPTDKRYFVETKLKKRPEMLGPVQNALVELGMLDIIDADTKWGTKTKDALAAYLSRKPDRLPDLPLQDYEVPALLAEAYGGYQENGKWFYSTGEPIVYPPKQNDTYLPARPLRPDEARRMAYEKRTEAQRNK